MNGLKVEMKKGWFLVLGLLLLMPLGVKAAAPDGDLPEADDPFWEVMAQIDRPDDSTCATKATAILETNGIPGGAERAAATCESISWILTGMQSTFEEEEISTNLFTETDWHHIDNLYFDEGDGRIEFTNEVNFMSRNFMLLLETIVDRLDFEQDEITFDADIVGGMRDAGAVVTMRNVSEFTDPEILVDGAEDTSGVVSGMVYNVDLDTIVFNAAHFTTFKAVERDSDSNSDSNIVSDNDNDTSSSSDAPKITKVSATKFYSSNGKEKIRVSIYGKRFDKKMKVKLGSVEAYSVHWKSKNKVTAYFSAKEVLKKAGDRPYLKIKNVDGSKDKYKKGVKIWKLEERKKK